MAGEGQRWFGVVVGAVLSLACGSDPQPIQAAAGGTSGSDPAGAGAGGTAAASTAGGGGMSGNAGVAGGSAGGSTGGTASGGSGNDSCPADPPAPAEGSLHDGDLVIATLADALAAQGLREVSGNLVITETYPGVLELPNLVAVGGDVSLQGRAVAGEPEETWAAITELRLANLRSIGGELFLYLTGLLVETDFRSLESVGERVYYMRNLALRRIGLDSLTEGPVDIQASPAAARCEIEAICAAAGEGTCGAEYSDPDCVCELRCGRLEPRC